MKHGEKELLKAIDEELNNIENHAERTESNDPYVYDAEYVKNRILKIRLYLKTLLEDQA